MTQLGSTASMCEAQWKMWLLKVFAVIYLAAVCAAQDDATAATQTITESVTTTHLPTTVFVPPKPVLELKSASSDVFTTEKVELKCTIPDISDWVITWMKDDFIKSDLSASPDGSVITIASVTTADSGRYTCRGQHRTKRGVNTDPSNPLSVKVTDRPTPTLTQRTKNADVFITEAVEFSCQVTSPDWTLFWHRDDNQLNEQGSSLEIPSVTEASKGLYACKAHFKPRNVTSEFSNKIELKVYANRPKPTLKRSSNIGKMYPGEAITFTCNVDVSSGWEYMWYHNGSEIQSRSSTYSLPSVAHSNTGEYYCKAKRGPFFTDQSASTILQVSATKAKPTLTRSSNFGKMYPGETITFTCRVDESSEWEYMWYHNGSEIQSPNSTYSLHSIAHSNSGEYYCKAERGLFSTDQSVPTILQVSATKAKPTLTRSSNFDKMYPGEAINFTCRVDESSGWEYMWYHNGSKIQSPNSTYSLHSIAQSNSGEYYCKAERGLFSTDQSVPTILQVSATKAKPTLTRSSNFDKMYPGEAINFTCRVDESSGWEYMWYHNGSEIQSRSSTYSLPSVAHSNSGEYYCKAKRGLFSTDQSVPTILQVSDPPKPVLKLLSSWLDVFPNEHLEFHCSGSSSEWTFSWYKDEKELPKDSVVELNEKGSVLKITSVSTSHQGRFACKAHLKSRGVTSGFSNTTDVKVYGSIPKPSLSRSSGFDLMYVGETVKFTCKVDVSSDWSYQWYKDEKELSNTGNTISINLSLSDQGKYSCKAKRGQVTTTGHSDKIQLDVKEIPVPTLDNMTQWLDVFPSETAKLRCQMKGSSGWTFTWYKDGKEVKADDVNIENDGSTLFIKAASTSHRGKYKCSGKLKNRSVSSSLSPEVTIHVYDAEPTVMLMKDKETSLFHTEDSVSFSCPINISSGWSYLWYKDGNHLQESKNHYNISQVKVADSGSYKCEVKRGKDKIIQYKSQAVKIIVHERPQASVILLTGWSEVFSTDSLVLKCEVEDSSYQWNYTWFKEQASLNPMPSEKHIVTPHNDPEQSLYFCKGIRNERPIYSKRSEAFKTKNLLLKRRILLSISGCLFFGIIAVFLGCIALRICRKPAPNEDKLDENLFATMANNASCPLVEYITDADLNAPPKEGEEEETVCSETTPLPISSKEDQAVTTNGHETTENGGGMVSFQH